MSHPHHALPRRAALAGLLLALGASGAAAQPRRATFAGTGQHLVLELLDDDLLHWELAPGPAPAEGAAIGSSVMVHRRDWPGPRQFRRAGPRLETAELRADVAPATLCVTVTDLRRGRPLTTFCPADAPAGERALTLARGGTRHAYGLGEQFLVPGEANGDWLGRERTPGAPTGNRMVNFAGGQVGNAQFPILYALGRGTDGFALFLDVVEAQRWDLRGETWRVAARAPRLRGYVMTGPDLADLRRDYVELTGAPPVPPREAFGLWVSEYGYESWGELESKLATLRQRGFPVDGFVLDLQWFGGIGTGSDTTRMGSLRWDTTRFAGPRATIARLRREQGVGIIPIEEPYVGRALPEHDTLAARGFLVRQRAGGPPVYLDRNPWWGKGGMVDFTSDAAAAFWHDWRRQPLVEDGVAGHWTDLGEPEMYDSTAWYHGVEPGRHDQAAAHNAYNLRWSASVWDGYRRHRVARRPFILSRSGTSGIQRYGVAMWSGDIGGDDASLAAHMNAQGHMSLSGMDYFGSDIGGFHRERIQADTLRDLYTRWFADGALLEVPVRVHTMNLGNFTETAPDRVGDAASNLANLRLRYALTPYYYALAHRARLHAEPLVAPLVYWHQEDTTARTIMDEKLVGRDLLVATATRVGAASRDVYLPAGEWFDWHTLERHAGGRWLRDVAFRPEGGFRLPLYARAGAIVPMMVVDSLTMNASGRRLDGSRGDALVVRAFPGAAGSFTLFEDDGATMAYADGAVATTALAQRPVGGGTTVTIGARRGTYAGAPVRRALVVELAAPRGSVREVRAGGVRLVRRERVEQIDVDGSGWAVTGTGLVVARLAAQPVDRAATFEFR